MDTERVAKNLTIGCPREAAADHRAIAQRLRAGARWDELRHMPELNRWPETYRWLRVEMTGR